MEVHKDLREQLGKSRYDDKATGSARITTYRDFVNELERRLEEDKKSGKWDEKAETMLPGSVSYLTKAGEGGRPEYVPHWLCQPYFRPPLVHGEPGGSERGKKKEADGGKLVDIKDVQTEGEKKLEKRSMLIGTRSCIFLPLLQLEVERKWS